MPVSAVRHRLGVGNRGGGVTEDSSVTEAEADASAVEAEDEAASENEAENEDEDAGEDDAIAVAASLEDEESGIAAVSEDEDTDVIASGTCGDDLTWVLDGDYVLTISGTGDMTGWSSSSEVPWISYRTSICSVTIGDSVTSIGALAFYGCEGLTDVYYTGSEEDWAAIEIGDDNECLTSATIHYNSTGLEDADIPDDALYYNGHYYYFYNDETYAWSYAEEYCESVGGYLVTITTEAEQNAVYNYVKDLADDEDIWIGLTDSTEEGNWSTWITGESVTYTNWGENEPDDYLASGQDYGVICNGYRDGGSSYYVEPGQWDDVGNLSLHFICEWGNIEPEDSDEFSISFTFCSESYVLLGEDTVYLSGDISVTGSDADIETELSAMTAESSDPSIAEVEFNPDGFLVSSDGKSASAFYAFIVTPHKLGMFTITLTASDGETLEKDFYVEPELVVSTGSNSVTCSVTLDEADAAYLEEFITQLTVELDMDKTGPVLDEKEYVIAEDGLSATYTWTYRVSADDSGTATVTSPGGQSVKENVSFTASDNQLYFTSRDIEADMLVEYSDTHFEESSYVYNHDLAWLSLCLELSSFTAASDQESWGETDEDSAQARYANIAASYEKMGFESANYYNYDKSLNDTSDQVAYSIASKTMSSGETLVAVVIRGGAYGAEWSSNFNVGDGTFYHEGFNTAATEVYESVLDYLSGINGDVKLWITGYSRGAATANLLAAKIDNNAASSDQYDAEDVFAYTFATPQGVTTNQGASAILYKNIFNIVNPGDVVPAVALSGWGFTRYGVTQYFNLNASDSVFSEVESTFSTYSGETFDAENNINQYAAVSALADIILKEYSSASSAASLLNVVQEILEYSNTKVENNGEWESISIEDYYDTLSLRYGSAKFAAALAKANQYRGTTETITLVLLCCELNGISCDEASNLLESILGTTATTSALFYLLNYLPDGFGGIAVSHYPSVYLAWMSLDEEDAFLSGNTDGISCGTTILSVACPVDVTVYGSDGTEIAVVVDHEIVEAAVPVVIEDDVVTVYLPGLEEYSVKITATDTGTMNYTVTELDLEQNTVNRLNYYDIELVEDRVFTGSVDTSTDYSDGKYDLVYVDDAGVETTISADERLTEDVAVSLDADISGSGTVSGTGTYRKGDTAVLRAYADDSYHFVGWYLGEDLISTEETTSICLTEDTAVTCVFEACTYEISSFDWEDDYSSCTATFVCSSCDDAQEIDCTVTSATTDATCTAEGETVYTATCTFNGEEYTDIQSVSIPLTEHSYEAVVTEPTCTEGGYTTYTCSACGSSYTEELDALGHDAVKVAAKAATDTEDGNIEYWYCAACGKYFSDEALTDELTLADTVIPATGDSEDDGDDDDSDGAEVVETSNSDTSATSEADTSATAEDSSADDAATATGSTATGDDANLTLYAALALAAALGLAGVLLVSRKRKS